ncbi:uncharacterized protein SPSK_02888 [Sporothrix schenckii 1099-18]|uniref:Uncharacterized protein n=1 Tax=Sporothrix schenckii 1099-18 TaxID=1397361 RepID=A0A0F2MCG2_SPOSC|nr:uncharacterized protein SPSK_02888 [Sporothrix schenckii 1099-18]KJR86505.1 hypothetical protein SPSK_02888 [Sporothrix schenckii 1099-18]
MGDAMLVWRGRWELQNVEHGEAETRVATHLTVRVVGREPRLPSRQLGWNLGARLLARLDNWNTRRTGRALRPEL